MYYWKDMLFFLSNIWAPNPTTPKGQASTITPPLIIVVGNNKSETDIKN